MKQSELLADDTAGYCRALEAVWRGQMPLVGMFDVCNGLTAVGREPLAAVLYQTWLRRNRTTHDHLVLFNLGVILVNQGDLEGACDAYARALRHAPDFLQARFNLGIAHERLGNPEVALAEWAWIDTHADAMQPEQRSMLLLALNNTGRLHEELGRYGLALSAMTKSLRLEPNQPDVIHHWVFLRAKQCIWPVYQDQPGLPEALQREHTSALAMIALSDDPAVQLGAARHYVSKKLRNDVSRLAPATHYGHDRIRIGYCSSDFCLHAVSMLTVELFELHDRDRFEVYGFDWSRDDGSALRRRVINAMDHVFPVHGLNDEQAAELIRQNEIDILIDLQGQTLGARPGMLAWRPAPIQVTYLGLPATTGLPSIDYVIADRFLIPEQYASFYSETPLYMNDVYQVCDRQREHAEIPSRAACGLPEDAIVFCAFNNNYKFTPDMFDAWMRILKQVPGSVLWLLADNEWARENLRAEALVRGIDRDRLIFAPRVMPAEYLSRYAVPDLFLDCYPYNGGTTVNDALWMGCPVLTLAGRTFASRMAGSLLTAAGLPELITTSLEDYVSKAVELGLTRGECVRLREHLVAQRAGGVLFDTPRFVRHLEAALTELMVR